MAGASSVFTVAPPSPGKCFTVAATRASRRPRIDARVRAAMPRSSPAKERVAITEPGRGTSATGARFTWIPAARSCRPAARAARRTLRGGPWKGWLAGGPACVDGADVAALLIDHDQCAAASGALKRAGEPPPLGAIAAVGAEEDHAGRLASA